MTLMNEKGERAECGVKRGSSVVTLAFACKNTSVEHTRGKGNRGYTRITPKLSRVAPKN